jgi:hypothetical protein
VCAFLCYCVLCALQSVERALRLGRPRWLIRFKLNSNFKNLYLNIQSFKNYEISSVGFIIF